MKAFEHQTKAFERFRKQEFGALFLEQGLGKSKVAIDLAEDRCLSGDITGVLIIPPKSLVSNWALTEIPKHAIIEDRCIVVFREGKLKIIEGNAKTAKITWFVANIDATITDAFVICFNNFIKQHPKFMLILDESTTVKSPKTKRTKRMWAIARRSSYRFILSGTPITNSPLDIWAQAEVLKPTLLGWPSFFLFKMRYADIVQIKLGPFKTFPKLNGYKNLPELTEKINKFAVIAKKADCLDLPEKIYRDVPCEFTKEQEKHYKEMKASALTTIESQEFTASNSLAIINMLLQICAGQVKLDDNGKYIHIPTNRIELMQDLIEESVEKSILWCSFVGAADALEQALGDAVYRIRRETPDAERQSILEAFERGNDRKGLILSQALSGKGLTILEGRNLIYYSQRFSVEQRLHSEDRSHRIGQTKSVVISDVFAPGTVEERMIKVVLKGNIELANKIVTSKPDLIRFIEGK